MPGIEYYAPSRVLFGQGVENQVGKMLTEYGAKKVLIHFGTGSVRKSGLLDSVEEELKKAGIEYIELGGVVPIQGSASFARESRYAKMRKLISYSQSAVAL